VIVGKVNRDPTAASGKPLFVACEGAGQRQGVGTVLDQLEYLTVSISAARGGFFDIDVLVNKRWLCRIRG